MFSLIVAMDNRGAIGRKNGLLWELPGDMKHFREYTKGKVVLMGTKTALSIGRALPGRTNLVLSRTGKAPYEGQIAVKEVCEVLRWHARHSSPEIVVCGGGEIYRQMLPYVSRMAITQVDTVVEDADAFFLPPERILAVDSWKTESRQDYVLNGDSAPFSISHYSRLTAY